MLDSKHVLVAEDNDVNYTLVAFILDKQGLTVSRAATGEQALERTLDEKPDLVLMDIQLPGMDGLEVTRRLRDNPTTHELPIVALTAFAMVGDEDRALAAGCDAYLTKPVSPHRLQETVERFIGKKQQEAGV